MMRSLLWVARRYMPSEGRNELTQLLDGLEITGTHFSDHSHQLCQSEDVFDQTVIVTLCDNDQSILVIVFIHHGEGIAVVVLRLGDIADVLAFAALHQLGVDIRHQLIAALKDVFSDMEIGAMMLAQHLFLTDELNQRNTRKALPFRRDGQ